MKVQDKIARIIRLGLRRAESPIDMAEKILKVRVNESNIKANKAEQLKAADEIINRVCEYCKVHPDTIKRKDRKAELVFVRYICFYLLREQTALSYSTIGSLFGKEHPKDHATVMCGIKKVKGLIEAGDMIVNECIEFVNNT